MRHITDDERRARLARRHALGPDSRVPDPETATRSMTVLHATEAPSVYLSLFARVENLKVADVDASLYEHRSLVKQLAMRRTLFVFPRDLLPAALGSASARVANQNGLRLIKEAEAAGLARNGAAWLAAARKAVVERLDNGDELSAQELRESIPEIGGRIQMAPGKKYGGEFSIAPRLLAQFGAEGSIVRGRNQGHWRTSRPLWTSMAAWMGEVPEPIPMREGYAELVRRWLWTFGPGTVDDIRWWLGSTVAAVKQALAAIAAVEVSLNGGVSGWVLPDDLEPVSAPAPWASLLPVLDPTTMGWKSRDFYLGPHAAELFDRNGNAGTTAWWNGRVVGCWVQDPAGVVELILLEDPGSKARKALQGEADRLTDWLEGKRVSTVYPSSAMRRPRFN